MRQRPFSRPLALWGLVTLALGGGCFTVDDEDAGPRDFDGGTVDLSRDSGPVPQPDAGPAQPDAGPQPQPDAGPPAVQIFSFTADSEAVAFLTGTTLRWNTTNASSCAVEPDLGTVGLPSGSQYISAKEPGDSVTYTLTCEGGGGPVSASVTVVTALVEHPGNFTANSASELSSLANVNVVTGNLRIENAASVTDLSVLETLVRVDGQLIVLGNPALATLDLPNLEEIGSALLLDDNGALTSLALPALQKIGERFYVSRSLSLPQAEIDDVVTQVNSAQGVLGPVIDYFNDPAVVIPSLDTVMLCASDAGAVRYRLDFYPDGSVDALDYAQPAVYAGTYERFESNLKVSFPGAGLEVTASATELEYDVVSYAHLGPTLEHCYLTGLPGTGDAASTTYVCPSAVVSQVEERNEVEVAPGGTAQWTNTRVGPQFAGGQLATQLPGAYVVDGEWLYFAFPTGIQTPTPVRFPVAKRTGAQLDVLDLLESQSPCTAGN